MDHFVGCGYKHGLTSCPAEPVRFYVKQMRSGTLLQCYCADHDLDRFGGGREVTRDEFENLVAVFEVMSR